MPKKTSWSSRERMLAALGCQPSDHTPCAFMIYGGLHKSCQSYTEFIQRQVDMDLDVVVELPPRAPVVVNDSYNLHGLPVHYHPRVTVEEHVARMPGESYPVMVKTYHTPAGTLTAEVRQTEDWRWGDHVPFLDDYITSRSRKFLLNSMQDLAAFNYLLDPPTSAEIVAFRAESEPARELAKQKGLLVAAGWGVGADLLGWVYGLEKMMYTSFDRPDFLAEMLARVARWNYSRMEVLLDARVDLFIKRAWYENCDFWSPRAWKKFLAPTLKAEVELAHQAGARFGYIVTSNCMPILGQIMEAGVDVIIGVDPHSWDMAVAKCVLGGEVCLWGGINGHLTVEQGTADEVRAEVDQALSTLAPGGGLILSPVDNVREDTPRSRENVTALIGEWKKSWLT